METTNAIQQIYIGLLGRAADQEGLQYWTDEIEAGTLTLEQLRANIVEEQPEYEATFGGQTRAQVVSQLYANLFNRAPDDEGLQYWVNGEGASVNIDQLVLALVNGAAAADTLVLDNRTEVANYYTEELGAEGSFDAELAGAVIADVDGTRASVTQAKASVDNGDITAPTPNEGNTFTLTAGLGEIVNGTANNDTFSAVLSGDGSANNGTLNIGDVINGQGGSDTLNVTVVDGTKGLPAGATLNSVEVLNLNNTSAATAFVTRAADPAVTPPVTAAIEANKLAGVQQIWQENFAVGVENLAATQTAGFRKTASNDLGTVAAAATATSANVAFDAATAADNTANSIKLAVNGAKLNTINVDGTIAKAAGATATSPAAKLVLNADVDAGAEAVTINTAVKTDLVITETGTAKDVVTLDASGSTGGIAVGTLATSFDNVENIKLGSGADSITLTTTGKNTVVEAGAGNDVVTVNFQGTGTAANVASKLDITLGDGNDTLVLSGLDTAANGNIGANVTNDAELTKALVTVTDFNASSDLLKVEAGSSFVTQNAVNTAVDGKATLLEAVQAVAAIGESQSTGSTKVAQFVFDNEVYAFVNDNDAVVDGGETLIKLAGVSDLLTASAVEGIA